MQRSLPVNKVGKIEFIVDMNKCSWNVIVNVLNINAPYCGKNDTQGAIRALLATPVVKLPPGIQGIAVSKYLELRKEIV